MKDVLSNLLNRFFVGLLFVFFLVCFVFFFGVFLGFFVVFDWLVGLLLCGDFLYGVFFWSLFCIN